MVAEAGQPERGDQSVLFVGLCKVHRRSLMYRLIYRMGCHAQALRVTTSRDESYPECGIDQNVLPTEYHWAELNKVYGYLSFSDNGPGISPEDIGHIFEPFFHDQTCWPGEQVWVCRLAIWHCRASRRQAGCRKIVRRAGGIHLTLPVESS